MGKSNDSLTSMAIDGSAAFARGRALLGVIGGVIMGIIFFIIGVYIFSSEDKYGNNQISGTIKDSQCRQDFTTKNKNTWDCSLNIRYNINNTDYLKNNYYLDNSSKNYNQGDSINLRYNSTNKEDITTDTWTNQNKAILLIIVSIFLIVGPIIWFVLVSKYKFLAVTDTAMFAMNNVFGSTRRYY